MPMVRSLDTIFHGLADTYQHQGRRYPQPGEPWQNFPGQDDHDRQREEAFGPGRRLYPRDANAPQPMAPPFGTLGEYVLSSFPIIHRSKTMLMRFIVYLNSFAQTLVMEQDKGLVEEYE